MTNNWPTWSVRYWLDTLRLRPEDWRLTDAGPADDVREEDVPEDDGPEDDGPEDADLAGTTHADAAHAAPLPG